MTRRTSTVVISAIFAILVSLFVPANGAATVYNVYEYFEGLPATYTPPGGQGYNFRETRPDVIVTPPRYMLGAGDVTLNRTTYTCVGWKNAFGITPESGDANSVTFDISSDVSITWIYKAARKVTILTAPPQGELNVWGDNDLGQLGDKVQTSTYATYATVSKSWPGFVSWDYITAGNFKTSAGIGTDAANSRSPITWGSNNHGQLGDGTTTSTHLPVWLRSFGSANAIAAGENSTVAVRIDGTLWAWGWQKYGQLGDGVSTDTNVLTPKRIGSDSNWRSVAAGQDFNLAIKNDGTLWGWGRNSNYGQAGVGSTADISTPRQIGTDSTWKMVVAGRTHAAAIKNDGSLWLWGNNGNGVFRY